MPYAEVAINTAVNQTFHYAIPPALETTLTRGHLVRVSFGTAMQAGIVVAIQAERPADLEDVTMKPIADLLHPDPVMTHDHIDLALWMSDAYLCSLGACLWLMLPPGIVGKSTQQVYLRPETDVTALDLTDYPQSQQNILTALAEEQPRSIDALRKISGIKSVKRAVRQLEDAGLVEMRAVLMPPTVTRKTVRTVMRAIPRDEIIDALAQLSRAPKQTQVFDYIAKFDYPLDVSDVYENADANSADLNKLARKGFVELGERLIYRDSLADRHYIPSKSLALTGDQDIVWQAIKDALQQDSAAEDKQFLLHGVTGSGKTEIYLHAIAETLAQGKQALLLVPEIALTPQTIRRVAQRFPEQVAVVHGSLSVGERFDTWRRARDGDIHVIVGTRSALFTPLPAIGLIILDESHDSSYKQSPPINPPYYQGRDVAQKLADLTGATLILGSATPAIETMYRATNGKLRLLEMPNRIMGHKQRVQKQAQQRGVTLAYHPAPDSTDAMTIDLPPVDIIDMRDELKAGNLSMFSRDLQASLAGVLERGEQAILFLNRRGQATYVFCRDCGYVVECPNCDTPLTYHSHGAAMQCHHCGHQANAPEKCPNCRSNRIRYFGAGTQQVQAAVRELFPQAKVLRWDRDTATKPDQHEAILGRFAEGDADILVGTQMIAKGLDIPLVTLVGVVSADPGLALPDFRANERAFQLLTQVAGRAGRGIKGGHVIIQTYQPAHASIIAAAQHDYAQFYDAELAARRELGYPPFRRLGRVLVQNAHPLEAERQIRAAAEQLAHRIKSDNLTDTHLIGPAPCFFSRIDRLYRWQVLVRSADPAQALKSIQTRTGWYIDIDPVDIL